MEDSNLLLSGTATEEKEIVASGELYKQTVSDSKTWVLRYFTLQGVYLSYSTTTLDGIKKGQIDITDCKLKIATPEECNNKCARYAFAIITRKKIHYICASSERNRVAWMIIIHEQAEANRSFRRHLRVGEQVVTSKPVKKREFNEELSTVATTNVLLIATNMPRVLVVHPINNNLIEEIKWDAQNPSVFEAETEYRFSLSNPETNEQLYFEDPVEGAVYWEYVYGSFASMQTYEPGAQPVVIDFEDDFEDATDYYTERSDISTGDDMTHMISPRSQLSLVDDIPEEAPESAAVEDTVETVSMLPENEVDEERELSSKVSLTTTAVLKQTQHKILPLDTGFASSNFLELQKRLEQKSANKKPPTFVPPASDKSLRTQFFGNHRVVTPLSSSSINVNSKK